VINLQLVDKLRQWREAVINGAASFVVSETTRIAGCAELSPTYELSVVPRVVEAGTSH
jgi:hypothetical protein